MFDEEIQKELKELQKQIEFSYTDPEEEPDDITPRKKLDEWLERFGRVSPKEIYNILSRDCGETHLRLPLDEPNNIELCHGSKPDYCKTILKVDELRFAHGITLEKMNVYGKRGAGTATKVLANLHTMIETEFPQIEHITVDARYTGSYAWARFGFVPHEINDHMREYLHNRKNEIAGQLTPEESKIIDKIIDSDDPKSIWSLADMAKPIHYPVTKQDPTRDRHQEQTLGKYLLIGMDWRGKLDLRDHEAVDRFKSYVAKLDVKRMIPGADKDGTTPAL